MSRNTASHLQRPLLLLAMNAGLMSTQMVTIRLDADVAEWFRGQGDGYQTKINAILHAYMTSHAS